MICSEIIFNFYKTSKKQYSANSDYLVLSNHPKDYKYYDRIDDHVIVISEDNFPSDDEMLSSFPNIKSIILKGVSKNIGNRKYFSNVEKLIIFPFQNHYSNLSLNAFLNVKELFIHDDPFNSIVIDYIPDEISCLKNLKRFHIELKDLSHIPDFFDHFPSLEIVNLTLCNLNELAPSLLNHQNIKFLNINSLQIVHIPALSEMINLDVFSLHWVAPYKRRIPYYCDNHIEYHYLQIPIQNIPLNFNKNLKIYLIDLYDNTIKEDNCLSYVYSECSLNYSLDDINILRNQFCNKLLLFGSHFDLYMPFVQTVFFKYLKKFTGIDRGHIWNVTEGLFELIIRSNSSNSSFDLKFCRHPIFKNNNFALNDLFTFYTDFYPKNFNNLNNLRFIIDYEAGDYMNRPVSIPSDIMSLTNLLTIYYPYDFPYHDDFYPYENLPISNELKNFLKTKTQKWARLQHNNALYSFDDSLESDELKEIFSLHLTKKQLDFDLVNRLNKQSYYQ